MPILACGEWRGAVRFWEARLTSRPQRAIVESTHGRTCHMPLFEHSLRPTSYTSTIFLAKQA